MKLRPKQFVVCFVPIVEGNPFRVCALAVSELRVKLFVGGFHYSSGPCHPDAERVVCVVQPIFQAVVADDYIGRLGVAP